MLERSCWLSLPLLLAAACNNSGSSAAPTASSSAAVSTPTASMSASAAPVAAASGSAGRGDMEHHGPGRGGDLTGMMFRSARDLPGMSADQRTKLDGLQGPLRGDDPGDPFKAFHDDLVSMVKAGKIDTAKITADEAAVDAATKALVAAIQAKQAEREARQAQNAPPPDAGAADMAAKRLTQLTTELGLDAGQQAQAKPILAKSMTTWAQMKTEQDAMKAKVAAFLTAFAADTFDASKAFPQDGSQMKDMRDKHLQMIEQLLPILHPDQQAKLAASMEKMRGGGHGPGGGDDDDHMGGGGGGGGGGGDQH